MIIKQSKKRKGWKINKYYKVCWRIQAFFNSDIEKLKTTSPIKVTIDVIKYLPSIQQTPLRPEELTGIRPIIHDYLKKGLTIPCTSPSMYYPSCKNV